MVFSWISRLAAVVASLVGLVAVSEGTKLDLFLRWLYLGPLIDFIRNNYPILMSILLTMILLRWIKDWRIVAGIFSLLVIFFYFVL